MPFDVDQNYGDLPEEEMPLTFKDCVARDIEMVFFNLDEFAEMRNIDGKDRMCIIQHPGVAERAAHWENGARQSFDEGMYKADLLLYIKKEDYGPMPKADKRMVMDGNKDYKIKSCSLKAGVYRMELMRVR